MPNIIPPTFVNAAGLARRVPCAPRTLARRITEGTVRPDAVLVERGESPLFKLSRIAEIRAAVLAPVTNHQTIAVR